MAEEKRITENFKKFIDLCNYFNFSKDDMWHIYVYLQDGLNEEETDKYLGDLFEYGLFRVNRGGLMPSHLISFVYLLKRIHGVERFQYLPIMRFVQYKGETTEELIQNEYYPLVVVYGYDEDGYCVFNEQREEKEYPAEWFVDVEPTRVVYKGLEKSEDNSQGFEVGQEYVVEKIDCLDVVCENGSVCKLYETTPLEFKVKKKKKLRKLQQCDAMNAVCRALEYGDVRMLAKRINEETEFISYNNDSVVKGRKNILEKLISQRNFIYNENVIVIANEMRTIEDHDKSGMKKGDEFLLLDYLYKDDKKVETDAAYVEYNNNFITKIIIKGVFPKSEYIYDYMVNHGDIKSE